MRSLALLSLALAAAGLSGCAALSGDVRPYPSVAPAAYAASPYAAATGYAPAPHPAAPHPAAPHPAAPHPEPYAYAYAHAPPPATGGIYRGGPGLNLFADNKARDVGDMLTINLVERTNAQSTANTAIDRNAGIEMSAPSLFGRPVTHNGRDLLSVDVEGGRNFAGRGDTRQSNSLSGSITVTVVDRLPNGNLLVQGSKQMRLNQGDELVQVQGVVRPADIAPDNSIASSRVGEARIVYGGSGTLARSNSMGWLGRFFNSPIAPY